MVSFCYRARNNLLRFIAFRSLPLAVFFFLKGTHNLFRNENNEFFILSNNVFLLLVRRFKIYAEQEP